MQAGIGWRRYGRWNGWRYDGRRHGWRHGRRHGRRSRAPAAAGDKQGGARKSEVEKAHDEAATGVEGRARVRGASVDPPGGPRAPAGEDPGTARVEVVPRKPADVGHRRRADASILARGEGAAAPCAPVRNLRPAADNRRRSGRALRRKEGFACGMQEGEEAGPAEQPSVAGGKIPVESRGAAVERCSEAEVAGATSTPVAAGDPDEEREVLARHFGEGAEAANARRHGWHGRYGWHGHGG
mmetsp:Transcript_3188/g.7497  ORF Transcript_3188/g.7497 Transcript_3188/m.7497 type:complete len:241 (+) Transcript_3188:1383-2105(+)